ncbi:MAG: cation diffusion facilitator family transporter [Erysipelotrichaceae bacterium]|nr:cation diffusion facilitator family transporter [Erysipelotrichaceae bacterium]MDY5252078.1 cation diffusion facilitator family transporter [Erysipelotrichaceae bacterium]
MTKLLINLFVKDHENINDDHVRWCYGMLSSLVGIFSNICLFLVKFVLGIISNSIAITSDAFNNLSDCVSCVITLFGYRLASKPADKDHPFGHGRMEYIVSIVISFFIFMVGIELFKSSLAKVINPEPVSFNIIVFIIMVITILVKVWMFMFNRYLGNKIDNPAMLATSQDSLNDCIATLATIVALVLGNFTALPIDGAMGIVVSIFILFSGYGIVKETLDDLLGRPADKELVEKIKTLIMANEHIIGIHDLIIHDYGPGKAIGSCHVEVNAHDSFVTVHDIVDEIEKKIQEELHIMMTLHMDPVDNDDELTNHYKTMVTNIIKGIDEKLSLHDFRIVTGPSHTNLIFDIVLPFDCTLKDEQIKKMIDDKLTAHKERIFTVITFDHDYCTH